MSQSPSKPSADTAAAPARDPVLLEDHHRRLERVCTDLLSDTYADDPRALCARWRRFEAEVLEHMRAEEEVILPGYEQVAPDEARAIRQEHGRLRELLQQLAIEVELHQIRAHTVRELLVGLQTHANREDAAMYPWAARELDVPRLASLRARIERWLDDAQDWLTA